MGKMYSLTVRNRAAGAVFAVAILGLGAVFLTVGLALLLALVVAGAALGAGVSFYRRLRGGSSASRMKLGEMGASAPNRVAGLDPAMEIQATRPAIVSPRNEVN